MEKRKPSHTVGGNVNWCSHYGEQYGGSLKNWFLFFLNLLDDVAVYSLLVFLFVTSMLNCRRSLYSLEAIPLFDYIW